jgi:hypothetical protein
VHLGVLFGLSAVGGLVTGLVGDSSGALAGAFGGLAAVTLGAGLLALQQRDPLMAWIADLLLAVSATYLAGSVAYLAVSQGTDDRRAVLVGALVALPYAAGLYVTHRRVWLQVAVVAAFVAALLSALAQRPEVPDPVYGAYLLVVAGFLALGAMSGVVRPVRSAAVLSALLATAGAQVLVSADAVGGSAVAAVVLGLVVAGVLLTGNRSLLPVSLGAGVVLLPQLLAPAVGEGHAIGLSLAAVGATVAWLTVDLVRRSPRPPQTGGVFAICTVLVLASSLTFFGGNELTDVLEAVVIAAFFAAAAAARRRPAAVLSGLLVVASLPGALAAPLGGGYFARSVVALVALGVVAWAAIALDRRAPRPAAAPYQQEVSLAGDGREWTVNASYPLVFDAVVAALGGGGVPLQLVDRAAGRVVAGNPVRPLLVVAIWANDPVRARVRAVGAQWDVNRLETDVAALLEKSVAAPH